jgi:hypothetical protein
MEVLRESNNENLNDSVEEISLEASLQTEQDRAEL